MPAESPVEVTGPPVDGQEHDPHRRGSGLPRRAAARVRRAPRRAPRGPQDPPRRGVAHRQARLPAGDPGRSATATGGWLRPRPTCVDRRVEMTGPTDRKMTINALNSGARVWLADMEDASTPHWHNVIGGQVNLRDAIRRTITFTNAKGKEYALRDRPAPRHHRDAPPRLALRRDGTSSSTAPRSSARWSTSACTSSTTRRSCSTAAAARTSTCRRRRATSRPGSGTTSSPSPSSGSGSRTARSARRCSSRPSRPRSRWTRSSTSCATTPPDSTPAGGTTCSASSSTSATAVPSSSCPTAALIGMPTPFMRAYAELLVQTCHRRGAFAIGGMSAFIPSRKDKEANERAFAKVREDKQREASQGFDGSWVAHPDLVPGLPGGLRRDPRRPAQPARRAARRRPRHRRGPARHRLGGGPDHPGRPDRQRRGGGPLPRGVARRPRRRRHPQPHGGRRHRRDLALADLAVGPQRLAARRRHPHHRRAGPRRHGAGARQDPRRARRRLRRPQLRDRVPRARAGRAGRRLRRLPDPARRTRRPRHERAPGGGRRRPG